MKQQISTNVLKLTEILKVYFEYSTNWFEKICWISFCRLISISLFIGSDRFLFQVNFTLKFNLTIFQLTVFQQETNLNSYFKTFFSLIVSLDGYSKALLRKILLIGHLLTGKKEEDLKLNLKYVKLENITTRLIYKVKLDKFSYLHL